MLTLLLSFFISLLTVLQANRFLRYRQWLDWFLGLALLFFANIVLVMTWAGLLHRMNNPWVVLGLQTVVLLLVFLVGWLWKKPLQKRFPFPVPALRLNAVRLSPALAVFLGVTILVALLNLIYVLFVPPNNNDSLIIHLSRIGMWHQTGSWLPWNTAVTWQLTFPMNAELAAYWTLLFTSGEHLLALLPYLSGILSAALVYLLAKELTGKKQIALFSALLWAAFPVVMMNFTSSRHDHVSSWLLLNAVYFLFVHSEEKNLSALLIAALSLGISIGTNYSVAGYLPGLAIFIFLLWLAYKKITCRELLFFSSFSIVFFAIFSAAIFVSNFIHFGAPLGPDAIEMTAQSQVSRHGSPLEHTALMTGRWGYQIIDFQAIPEPYRTKLMEIKASLPQKISAAGGFSLENEHSLLNQHQFFYQEAIPFSEDSAWFGLTGAFVFIVAGIFTLISAIRRRHPLMVLSALFLITVPLAFSFLRAGWTPYDGRYFITLFAFLCLSIAQLFSVIKAWLRWILLYGLTLVSILTLAMNIIANPAKAFWGYKAFWRHHRFDSLTAQSYDTKDMVYLVDQNVPLDGTLGIATRADVYYEYGLFGENFTRRIVPVFPPEKICDDTWLRQQGIEYILVDYGNEREYPPCSLGDYDSLNSARNWIVFKIN